MTEKKQLDGKFELMHVVWNSNLKANQKNLLNYLLALADKDGECFPNTDQIAKVCGVKNQRRLTPVVDQLPGLVSVTVKGRKNYYKVDLKAIRALEEKEVVLKVTPPTGANTPPAGAVYPPNGGVSYPPNGGAYTTSYTTLDTTNETTVKVASPTLPASANASAPQNKDYRNDKDNQTTPALRAAPVSPIVLNDDVSPIFSNDEASPIVSKKGAAAGGGRVTDRWKASQGIKVIEPEDAFKDWKPAPKVEKPKCEACGTELLSGLCWTCA